MSEHVSSIYLTDNNQLKIQAPAGGATIVDEIDIKRMGADVDLLLGRGSELDAAKAELKRVVATQDAAKAELARLAALVAELMETTTATTTKTTATSTTRTTATSTTGTTQKVSTTGCSVSAASEFELKLDYKGDQTAWACGITETRDAAGKPNWNSLVDACNGALKFGVASPGPLSKMGMASHSPTWLALRKAYPGAWLMSGTPVRNCGWGDLEAQIPPNGDGATTCSLGSVSNTNHDVPPIKDCGGNWDHATNMRFCSSANGGCYAKTYGYGALCTHSTLQLDARKGKSSWPSAVAPSSLSPTEALVLCIAPPASVDPNAYLWHGVWRSDN